MFGKSLFVPVDKKISITEIKQKNIEYFLYLLSETSSEENPRIGMMKLAGIQIHCNTSFSGIKLECCHHISVSLNVLIIPLFLLSISIVSRVKIMLGLGAVANIAVYMNGRIQNEFIKTNNRSGT
mgnify:CR=1 FL=1